MRPEAILRWVLDQVNARSLTVISSQPFRSTGRRHVCLLRRNLLRYAWDRLFEGGDLAADGVLANHLQICTVHA